MSARPHFSIVKIPVRVEPVFFVMAGLWGLRYIDLGIHIVALWIACTFVSILVHELGHGFALKAFGQRSAIVLHGFGGVTVSNRRDQLSKARGILVSLAGSITAMALLWLPARTVWNAGLESGSIRTWSDFAFFGVQFIAFQNLWWSVANLLPIRPLDGGNVSAELFGIHAARRISIATAIAAAIFALTHDSTYAAFFALFLAFNNWQEIRAEQQGAEVNVFEVEAPDPGTDRPHRPRGRPNLTVVSGGGAGAPTLAPQDPARAQQLAWGALRDGDAAAAQRLVAGLGPDAGAFLRASTALATGDSKAFELFEEAYVATPGGPPNLVATEVLARSGAVTVLADRLVRRSDGKGLEGAATLQTHLHYSDHFREAAQVGEAVYSAGPASRAQTAFEVACSWAKAGDVDQSVTWLDHAADAGFRAPSVVDGEPDLAVVRTDPRWPVLRARLA